MTRAQYRREVQTVTVLCDLLAQEIRSFAPPGKTTSRLEACVESVPGKFAALAKKAMPSAAERTLIRKFRQDLKKLRQNGRTKTRAQAR